MILLLILILFVLFFPKVFEEKIDISKKIGQKWSGGSMTTTEYATISECSALYLDSLCKQDYVKAYHLLTPTYRSYITQEEFEKPLKQQIVSTYEIQSIQPLTQNAYQVNVIVNESQKEQFLVLIEENAFHIAPDLFLEYRAFEKVLKEGKASYQVHEMINYSNRCVVKMTITNTDRRRDLKVINMQLLSDESRLRKSDFEMTTIAPRETKTLEITFETQVDFPMGLWMQLQLGEKKVQEVTLEFSKLKEVFSWKERI